MTPEILMIGVVLLLGSGIAYYTYSRKRGAERSSVGRPALRAAAVSTPLPNDVIGAEKESTEATLAAAKHHFYCTAFGVSRFDYAIRDTHRQVLIEAQQSLGKIVEQERFLPRRPLLIPQLLRALNDADSTRQELSSIILQDPVLAGDVLKLANSSYYRIAREPVDTLDRAILLLGTEGLKGVVAASILQPVFRLPKGHFDAFAATLWDLAIRTSTATGAWAVQAHAADRAAAQLLGLLSALGPLAIFRLTSDVYRHHADVLPRAEVFVRLIDSEADTVSSMIATHWNLPAAFVTALVESQHIGDDAAPYPLGKALRTGRQIALITKAHTDGKIPTDTCHAALRTLGVEDEVARSFLQESFGQPHSRSV